MLFVWFLFFNSVKFFDLFIDFVNINGERFFRLDNYFFFEIVFLIEYEIVIVWIMVFLVVYGRMLNLRVLCIKKKKMKMWLWFKFEGE